MSDALAAAPVAKELLGVDNAQVLHHRQVVPLKAYFERNGLPVLIWVCSPNLSDNWLVSIIGGRVVASLPGNSAKCQQQIKASPLDRTKRTVIQKEMGSNFASDTIVTLIGTRRDESAVRGRNMAARSESRVGRAPGRAVIREKITKRIEPRSGRDY